MSGVRRSSRNIGPTLPGFETCETATEQRLWPTPREGRAGRTVKVYPGERRHGDLEEDVARAASPPLTSSVVASPASPSPTPADAQENPIAAGFGLSSTESFARLNPDGSWSKMYQGCVQSKMLLGGTGGSLEAYSETWPKRGTMRSGSTYPLPTSGRPISESESSLWPTPREFMHKDTTTDRGKSNLGEVVGGQLNPMWVELLMGFPAGWTELD